MLIFILSMLFKKFVQQHRVHLVVAHGLDLAFLVAADQVGVHLLDVFGDEAQHRCASGIKLFFVAEADRLEREKHFTGFTHGLDLFLVSARGGKRPDLVVGIDVDRSQTGDRCLNVANTGRVTLASNAIDICANIHVATARREIFTSAKAHGHIVIAGADDRQRADAYGRVKIAIQKA